MESGDLLFIRGDCYASPFIRFFLKSNYTHVTIVLDEEYICEVDLFTKMKIMKNPYTEYDLYRIKGNMSVLQKRQLVQYLKKKSEQSKGYDWWRIVSLCLQKYLRFNIIIHSPDRYICSEIIDKAYQHIGIDLVDHRVTGDVTPLDLMNSNRLTHLYSKYEQELLQVSNRDMNA
jgi:hypothetical protein